MSILSYHDFYPNDVVRTDPQDLSDGQKKRVRENIGAAAKNEIVGGGLTPEQVKKLAEIDDKLDKSQLQTAINQALLQAQQSGLFDGQDGQTPQLSIGTITTLEPGANATASITGPTENLKLNLGIPRGKDGGAGKAGGYYTPKVAEIAPGEYQITFEASAPDMPAVGPVQLTLPSPKPAGIPIKAMTASTATLDPDVDYRWEETAALTIDLKPVDDGLSHDYMFRFRSGEVPTTLNLPGDIKWANPLEIKAGKMYQMLIHDGGGLYAEF